MTPRIALCLTTCDRPAYTERTLLSLAEHNDLGRFTLLQGDDASQDSRNADMGRVMGFDLVHAPTERQGHMASVRALVRAAQELECDYTLVLEADYESVRLIPLEAFEIPGWQSFRLYGAMKMRSGPRAPTGTHIMGAGKRIEWEGPVWRRFGWSQDGETAIVRPDSDYQFAKEAHWTPNSITATAWLAQYTHLPRVKDVCLQWHPPTLRVVENVLWHIGNDGTPGFRP